MGKAGHKLLAVGGIRGDVRPFERLLAEASAGADAVAVVGDLGAPWSKPETYRAIFKVLGTAGRPAFWVPGPTDAPLSDYLRESYNMEIVYPLLHGLHGVLAFGPGDVLFAGMGGEIVDDPKALRAEEALLRYPGWEVEYRLKPLREFDEYQKVFLFTTSPAHKGLREPGSAVLAQLIKTHNPRVVIVAGERPSQRRLGNTLVVCPGRIDQGRFALVDLLGLAVADGVVVEPTVIETAFSESEKTNDRREEGGKRMTQTLPERSSPAASERWDDQLDQVAERMRRLLNQTFGGLGWPSSPTDAVGWAPLVDIEEEDDSYVIEADLPGVKRDDVNIELVGRELTITGEIKERERKGVLRRQTRRTGHFTYRVILPEEVDPEKIDAKLADGVLTVRVAKAQRAERRRIDVESA
jgi:HSP20 family molecular chaperone IbpA/Icc-related predicted phosphoesterase